MLPRRLVRWLFVVMAVVGVRAEADTLVHLRDWASPGTLIRGNGQGPDLIGLVAEAEWDRAASRDHSRYLVRVTLPGGGVETRPLPPNSAPGRRRVPVYVTAASVRNLAPDLVRIRAEIIDAGSGATLSNALEAGIDQFPRPRGDVTAVDLGPFGRGRPLEGTIRTLPLAGPDGLRFARIPGQPDAPGFFIATTEATVRQVSERLKGYDPRRGRSDEFALEGPDQPAIGLAPSKALDYLDALGQADPAGVRFRLPTPQEWTRAARAGRTSNFWWGDEPTHPEGANFLGPEPALMADATATSQPSGPPPSFQANPIGLFHTFGNVDEWASLPEVGFFRMGGHFRTEPASPLPEIKVLGPDELGPDPFVGVRPAFDLDPEAASSLIRQRLAEVPALAGIGVAFDPESAAVTLTGHVAEPASRRMADRLLEGFWFLAAVVNRLETPASTPGQVARLGPLSGPIRRSSSLRGSFLELPLAVQWLDPLPVEGSEWWVNIEWPGGGPLAHKLPSGTPGRSKSILAVIDLGQAGGLAREGSTVMTITLSLGGPSTTLGASSLASNRADVRLVGPTRSP